MNNLARKGIFISHSSKDNDFVNQLAERLRRAMGPSEVWVDLFDLDGGDELVPVISRAIQKAKWFILVATKNALESRWVQHEATLATVRAIEDNDFR